MNCKSCRHWQGNRYTKWADCNWVIGTIEPKLLTEKNQFENYFRLPFDPHDVYYYDACSVFHSIYNNAKNKTKGIRGLKVEKVKRMHFFITREDYCCDYFSE